MDSCGGRWPSVAAWIFQNPFCRIVDTSWNHSCFARRKESTDIGTDKRKNSGSATGDRTEGLWLCAPVLWPLSYHTATATALKFFRFSVPMSVFSFRRVKQEWFHLTCLVLSGSAFWYVDTSLKSFAQGWGSLICWDGQDERCITDSKWNNVCRSIYVHREEIGPGVLPRRTPVVIKEKFGGKMPTNAWILRLDKQFVSH